jgi:hypothetical protein
MKKWNRRKRRELRQKTLCSLFAPVKGASSLRTLRSLWSIQLWLLLVTLRLCVKYPVDKALERELRRFKPPEVPRDVWTGCEQAEDGRGIEIRHGHFKLRPG